MKRSFFKVRMATAMLCITLLSACHSGRRESTEAYDMTTDALEVAAPEAMNTESYAYIKENGFQDATHTPLSTFSVDVDAASYANVRRFITSGQKPPVDAVRIEELVNYFDYEYPQPTANQPFSVTTEVGICPWNPEHHLVHIGLQGKKLATEDLPASNLVFLIDVSGSMNEPDKLPLLQKAFGLLTDNLRPKDKVAIVVYAGAAGLVLPATSGTDTEQILSAIENLQAGGSTAGGEGIRLAYQVAEDNFIKGGNNRIILATDGDFNVGVSSDSEMIRLVEEKRKSGVFLTVIGFGTGNIKDSKMEGIADHGNGNYYYIDSEMEARKVLVSEMGGTLFTIAKDVKIQVEFNPVAVKSYRLLGYENRLLEDKDFTDDTKDAGEIGAGHTVTALYEVELVSNKQNGAPALKYQNRTPNEVARTSGELVTLKLRYKKPDGDISKEIVQVVTKDQIRIETSDNFRFSAAVAAYGMLLRNSDYKADATYNKVIIWAKGAKGVDLSSYRSDFINMVESTQNLGEVTVARDE
ncbi:VWA domain-containing protein [Xanthocytophaga agilis]|uniref:VWA domain-containing protein n=1 Tax=Xanthocytophaga agilis TaxID=3048010 RepID=A0AAE3R551_9BACT|nr:VWA domain-containing protein [Xanthocytophaga agilis]MDJ1501777.1 VWA domain-containing protein [Xanthocytophaga agilis]